MNGRILLVDDEETNVVLLDAVLRQEGYEDLHGTSDPREAIRLFVELEPDLVLLDLHMPFMDGFSVMDALHKVTPKDAYVPIVVLTADARKEARDRALGAGANDFITKPFDRTEVLLRIKSLLHTRSLHQQLAGRAEELDAAVKERTRELESANAELERARLETLEVLAQLAEMRDDDTGRHTYRVGRISALVAQALGRPAEEIELLRRAAPLHDVGKIGIPDAILLKPSRLDREELARMRAHTLHGWTMLSRFASPVLMLGAEIALTHHERWDGKGYPKGKRAHAIPLSGRIVAVADTFDALINHRPYKPAWTLEAATQEIEQQRGKQFDPAIADAFLSLVPQLTAVLRMLEIEVRAG